MCGSKMATDIGGKIKASQAARGKFPRPALPAPAKPRNMVGIYDMLTKASKR